uniref:60S ribosome subunit biogenesis protein NIP7 homolog n=1 Tax=Esox lucius TaxID=8010 RepID=A0AAY5KY43_ESOLU
MLVDARLYLTSYVLDIVCLQMARDLQCSEYLQGLKKSLFSVHSIGENIKLLVDRPDGTYCFRLHNDRVYYISERILKLATNISRDKLVSVGTCFGKFTKTLKFRLHITALDFLAPYAKFKVWVKPGQEQSFLYGNHVLKSGLGRITENTNQYQGVVVYSMSDVPLGFGVAAKSTQECRRVDPMSIVVFHQADIGEFIRSEDTLT